MNQHVQDELDGIVMDIIDIGVIPRGFYFTQPLNGTFFMEAMKQEALALIRLPNRTEEQEARMTVLIDQYNRLLSVIKQDIEQEETDRLAALTRQQRRYVQRRSQ